MGFPGGSAGKESTCNVGALGLIPGFDPWLGRSRDVRVLGLQDFADACSYNLEVHNAMMWQAQASQENSLRFYTGDAAITGVGVGVGRGPSVG